MIIKPEISMQIERDYEHALSYFGELKCKIQDKIASLKDKEALFMKYLYAYMPLSDVGDYDFEIIYSYAKHAAYLLENSPYLEKIPQEYFFNYVLSHRVNSEDITDCRRFFYDQTIERIKGKNMYEAVVELNNWCYEQATYRSTCIRTASPITVYKSGYGRCGEESTFLVTVLRSVGIPTRQIYVPRWSHSDSNHAWVEVWCEGEWYFTGACEPKPVLNNGWFTYAASRAMLVHSRVFTGFGYSEEEVVTKDGAATLLDNSAMYLPGKNFTVYVKDESGNPVEDALVRFEIVNSSEFFPIATLKTGATGCVRIVLGRGDVHLHVIKGGRSSMQMVDIKSRNEATVILGKGESPLYDLWQEYHITAPDSAKMNGVELSAKQEEEQQKRNNMGDRLRQERIEGYYDEEYVKQFQNYPDITKVLEKAKGNFGELKKFLDETYEGVSLEDKAALLRYISDKDCRDITSKILEDQLCALIYKDIYPKEIFEKYVLSPRVCYEVLTTFRSFIKEKMGSKGEELVRKPKELWRWINQEIIFYPLKEYTTIIATPRSILTMKCGTPLAKKVLFVLICRTYGLAARLDEVYGEPQYYHEGAFHYLDESFMETATLTLVSEDKQTPVYYQQFTMAKKQPDGTYETLDLWGREFSDDKLILSLSPGEYRILTSDRMKSGSIMGKQLYIQLSSGDSKTYSLKCTILSPEDLQQVSELPEFTLKAKEGEWVQSSAILGSGKNILVFADTGKEPTEHVFNELLEVAKMSGEPECGLHIVLKDESAFKDETLIKIQYAFPHAKYWFDETAENLTLLAKAVGVDGKKLPLVIVTEGAGKSLYSCSGYNVGCVDLLMRQL